MSLLSPEFLTVFISPAELVALHWRGLRPRIAEKYCIPLPPGGATTWTGAVQAFADLLRASPACRRVRVILSSHFVHYQLMPWRDDLNDSDEELAIARLAFTRTYAEAASAWQVRISDEAPGRNKVAAAIDSELLAALEEAATIARARLVSVQPYLAATANYWQHSFDRKQASWLVVHEAGRLCLALAERRQWRWIRALRIGENWAADLPTLLDNENLLAGSDDTPTQALIYAPAISQLAVPAESRWSFRCLQPEASRNFSPLTDSRFGFALVG